LTATAVLTTSLRAWREQPDLYRPLCVICVAVSVLSLGLAVWRPKPVLFGLALVGLFSIPWVFAVLRVTRRDTPSPA